MRTPEEIAEEYEKATKENPLVIYADESESFSKAMKIVQKRYDFNSAKSHMQIVKDIEPYLNTIDGKPVKSRREHKEFLKRNGCFEIGNDVPKPSQQLRGDFNVRPELSKAVYEALNK